jgi:hypothetical protein
MNNYYHIVDAGIEDRDATKVSIEYFRKMFNRKTWGRYISNPPINAIVRALEWTKFTQKQCPCCGVTPPPMVQDLFNFVQEHESPVEALSKMRNMGGKRLAEALWFYNKLHEYFVEKTGEHPEHTTEF